MKYIKLVLAGLVAAALLTTTLTAATATNEVASPQADQWRMSLAGGGAIATEGPADATWGLTLSLAREVTVVIPSELGVRQGIGWANQPNENAGSWGFNTTLFNDWRIVKLGSVELLAGGRIGASYGNLDMAWAGGPEAEVRLWMKKDVYTFLRGSYDWAISDNGFKRENSVGLLAGIGFSF